MAAPTQRELAEKALKLKRASAQKAYSTPPAFVNQNKKYAASAALAAEANADRDDIETRAHPPRAPPLGVRLLGKAEICAITGVSFVTVWGWMRAGKFPLARICGGKSKWLSTEIERWITELPLRALKGDDQQQEEFA